MRCPFHQFAGSDGESPFSRTYTLGRDWELRLFPWYLVGSRGGLQRGGGSARLIEARGREGRIEHSQGWTSGAGITYC